MNNPAQFDHAALAIVKPGVDGGLLELQKQLEKFWADPSGQADAIRGAMNARRDDAGRYNLIFRNCAQAVESFLHAGGVSGVPHGEIFVPAVLHDVLLLERGSQ